MWSNMHTEPDTLHTSGFAFTCMHCFLTLWYCTHNAVPKLMHMSMVKWYHGSATWPQASPTQLWRQKSVFHLLHADHLCHLKACVAKLCRFGCRSWLIESVMRFRWLSVPSLLMRYRRNTAWIASQKLYGQLIARITDTKHHMVHGCIKKLVRTASLMPSTNTWWLSTQWHYFSSFLAGKVTQQLFTGHTYLPMLPSAVSGIWCVHTWHYAGRGIVQAFSWGCNCAGVSPGPSKSAGT